MGFSTVPVSFGEKYLLPKISLVEAQQIGAPDARIPSERTIPFIAVNQAGLYARAFAPRYGASGVYAK